LVPAFRELLLMVPAETLIVARKKRAPGAKTNPHLFAQPISFRGSLGLYDVPDIIIEHALLHAAGLSVGSWLRS
jgi:hypothetical protein